MWWAIAAQAAQMSVGLWQGIKGSQTQAKAQKLSYEAAANEVGGKITQTKSDIQSYQEYLAALPDQQALQRTQFETQAKDEFTNLLSNVGMQDVAAGASDRSGASVSAVAGEALGKLTDFSGKDQVLGGGDGGTYELEKTNLATEQTMETTAATRQLDVYKQTLGVLEENKNLYEDAADDTDTSFWGQMF